MKTTTYWTVCGHVNCGKRFEVIAPDKLTKQGIEEVFIEKHEVHLFPSRCKEHYQAPEESE